MAYKALAVVFEYDELRVVKREYLKAADWLDLEKEWLEKVDKLQTLQAEL